MFFYLIEDHHDGDGRGDPAAGGEEVQQEPQVPVVVVDVIQLTKHLQVQADQLNMTVVFLVPCKKKYIYLIKNKFSNFISYIYIFLFL